LAGYVSPNIGANMRLEEAKRTLNNAIDGLKIRPSAANKIVSQEFRRVRVAMVNEISRKTGLSKAQTRRRVHMSRGRTYKSTKLKWKFAQIKTGGKAQIIHAGRLKPRMAGRRKKAGLIVQGQKLPKGFFWNPKGKTLQRDERRVYSRTILGGKIRAIREADLGKPRITKIYATYGKRLEAIVIKRLAKRILRTAIPTVRKSRAI